MLKVKFGKRKQAEETPQGFRKLSEEDPAQSWENQPQSGENLHEEVVGRTEEENGSSAPVCAEANESGEETKIEDKPSEESFIEKWLARRESSSALAFLRQAAAEGGKDAEKIALSLERIDGFRDGSAYKEESIDAALATLLDLAAEGLSGAVDVENLELLLKGAAYDGDMDKARAEGELAGRNAVIEERFRTSSEGDGVPRLGGSSASADTRRPDTIFDLASFAR